MSKQYQAKENKKEAKSKTQINSFGNTMGSAMLTANDFGNHGTAKVPKNKSKVINGKVVKPNQASGTLNKYNLVNTEIQNSMENLQ